MSTTVKNKTLISWVILIFLSIIWGSSFILIKKSLIAFDPGQVAALRIFIAAVIFFPLVILKWKLVDWSKLKYFAIVALCGNGIPSYLYPLAETVLSSSLSGILNGLTPLFTILLGLLIFGIKYKPVQYLGVAIGFIGAAILILCGPEESNLENLEYGLYVVLGTICYALSVNTVNKYLHDVDSVVISGVSFLMIGPLALIYLVSTDIVNTMQTHPQAFLSTVSVAFLAIFGTALALFFFYKLIQIADALFASSVAFVIPIVAIFWGYLDGEYLLLIQFFGMFLILCGVYLIQQRKSRS